MPLRLHLGVQRSNYLSAVAKATPCPARRGPQLTQRTTSPVRRRPIRVMIRVLHRKADLRYHDSQS